jgi:hypothetical protein
MISGLKWQSCPGCYKEREVSSLREMGPAGNEEGD